MTTKTAERLLWCCVVLMCAIWFAVVGYVTNWHIAGLVISLALIRAWRGE